MKFDSKLTKPLSALYRVLNRYSPTHQEVEKAEQTFYIQYLQPGMVSFDVGANVGELTLLFSRFVGPKGQVHSFECSPNTYRQLSEIVRISNRKNIITNNVCLSDTIGTAEFHIYDAEHATWNTLAKRPLEQYGVNIKPKDVINVQTTTLDEYCDTNNINRIDLLKIDVEGAEYQVLSGASRMMSEGRIKRIVFEFGQTTFDMGNDPDKLTHLITSRGYKISNLVKNAPVFPGGASATTAQFSMHICTPV